ncbi:MAG: hypothetical protein ACPG8A_03305 [Psychrobium sp.]
MVEGLKEHQPHLVIVLDGETFIIPVQLLREIKRGQYVGDNALMARLLATYLLDNE